jgi:ribonuclease D
LLALDGLDPRGVRKYGRKLLEVAHGSLNLDSAELPPSPETRVDLARHRGSQKKLKRVVARIAGELELPPELLATRRTLDHLLERALRGDEPLLPSELDGWRREVVGEALLEVVRPVVSG